MSAKRARSYRPPRDRHEVVVAALGSAAVLIVTGLLLWLLAPEPETSPAPVQFTPTTTVPAGATPSSSTPAG